MGSSHTLTLFIFNSLLLTLTSSSVSSAAEKTSHLHFYFQDRLSGSNPSAVRIIGEGGFGNTTIIDDALTRLQKRDSEIVGRAQGMYSSAAQSDLAFLMVLTFSFSQGKYNGSSLTMLGRNHVWDHVREMPIVGGSGLFRLARGYALAHTAAFDRTTGDATVEYNVSVIHF